MVYLAALSVYYARAQHNRETQEEVKSDRGPDTGPVSDGVKIKKPAAKVNLDTLG